MQSNVPKILFLARSLEVGGTERQIVELAKGMAQRGLDVAIMVFYPGGGLERELAGYPIRLLSLNKRGRYDIPRFLFRFIQALRRYRPAFILGNLVSANLMTASARWVVPSTRRFIGLRASRIGPEYLDGLTRICNMAEKLTSRWIHGVIVNSQSGRREAVRRGFPSQKLFVIPNGVDPDRFRLDEPARMRIRRQLGVPPHSVLLGTIGRLDPLKGHLFFLEAFSQIAERFPEITGLIVGEGAPDYVQSLKASADALRISKRLIWIGYRDDMPAIYNGLDILVSASRTEGFPNVLLEAMACGIMCVATDVGDSRVIVGDLGIIVPSENPGALAAGVGQALEIRSRVSRESIRQRALNDFSVQTLVDRTCRVIGLEP